MFTSQVFSNILDTLTYSGEFLTNNENYVYDIYYNYRQYMILLSKNEKCGSVSIWTELPKEICDLYDDDVDYWDYFYQHTLLDNPDYDHIENTRIDTMIQKWKTSSMCIRTYNFEIPENCYPTNGYTDINTPLVNSQKVITSLLINTLMELKNIPLNPLTQNLIITRQKLKGIVYIVTDPSGKHVEKAFLLSADTETDNCTPEYDLPQETEKFSFTCNTFNYQTLLNSWGCNNEK